MSILQMVQHSTQTTYTLVWERKDGSVIDTSGATLTGFIRNSAGVVRKITGTLTGGAASLTWAPSAADVNVAGHFFYFVRAKYSATGRYEYSPWHQLIIHETTDIEFASASASPSGSASPSASASASS